MKTHYLACAFAIVLWLAGCIPTSPMGPTSTPEGMLEGQAVVESIEIVILESFPVQAQALVKGNLPDGCTKIKEANTTLEGNTFHINLITERSAGAPCTEALVPFEEMIPLDVAGLLKGDYTLEVNGVTETFQLLADNILGTASPVSGEAKEIVWAEAEALILSGTVAQVTQFHSLQVTLTLNDGRQVITTEPAIDEVMRVIETCGDPCANMLIATE